MNKEFQSLCEGLTKEIQASYEEGATLDQAEKLAGKFLHAMIQVSNELRECDLDARMRKSGLKAIKSRVRNDELKKHEKKPTEGALDDVVNLSEIVQSSQDDFDEAEVDKDLLSNYLSIFKEAHVHYRGIAKGRFE